MCSLQFSLWIDATPCNQANSQKYPKSPVKWALSWEIWGPGPNVANPPVKWV